MENLNPSCPVDMDETTFVGFKEAMNGHFEQLYQQIRELSQLNNNLSQSHARLSEEYCQLSQKYRQQSEKVSEYESRQAQEAQQRDAVTYLVRESQVASRIERLFKDHPRIKKQACDDGPPDRSSCSADVQYYLALLESLKTTTRHHKRLEELGGSIAQLEKDFIDRYKLHPSVFKNGPYSIPSRLGSAIDMRADVTSFKRSDWLDRVEEREQLDRECTKIIDSWVNQTEEHPYADKENTQMIDDLN